MTSSRPSRSLADLRPDLASQWDVTANSLSPAEVTVSSGRRVVWVCAEGHRWVARVVDRNRGRGCPRVHYADSLQAKNPVLASQWDYEANSELTPTDITVNSARKVWWICKEGHRWAAKVYNRNLANGSGHGCGRPHAGQSLQCVNPHLAEEWDSAANGLLTPKDVFPGSRVKAHWICPEGHRWVAEVKARNRGDGCPSLHWADSLAGKAPAIAEEWDAAANGGVTPADVAAGSDRTAYWTCARGHRWAARIYSRTQGHDCPQCAMNGTSRQEQELRAAVRRVVPTAAAGTRLPHPSVAGGLRPDILATGHCVVVEFDGSWWHRNTLSTDRLRISQYEDLGLSVIRVREAPLSRVGPWDISIGRYGSYDMAQVAGIVIRQIRRVAAVRMAVSRGVIDLATVHDGGHQLHDDYRAMAVANGCDPDAPELTACRAGYDVESRLLDPTSGPRSLYQVDR